MTAPVSLLPPMAGWTFPAPSVPALAEDEQRLVTGLSAKLMVQTPLALIRYAYYDGLQRLQNLGISIPPQLAGVRTVVDWPRICCDPLVQRARVAGFRLPGETEVNDELEGFWNANDGDGEAPLAFLDSLVAGRGYMIVGSPDDPADAPLLTVESPLNMAMMWDPRTRRATAAYQAYEVEGVYRAVLYLPDQTVSMSREQYGSGWVVDDRDEHNMGEVPVVRLPNRMRSSDREGRSEITPAIMNTTDEATRTLLAMAIGREFYSVPHRYVLGASEDSFVDAQGNKKTSWDMAMNKFLGLERDENGDIPTVGQFTAMDPSVFTKIIDEHAQLMASYTGFPPSYFGQTTTANPASADAIRVSENGLVTRARDVCNQWTPAIRKVAQLMWRFANDAAPLPADVKRLEVDWYEVATPTPSATSDAMTKQAGAGMVPPTSDVVLAKLGYTPLERKRLEQDRKVDQAAQIEAELARSIEARYARTDSAIAHDIGAPPVATEGQPVQPPAGPAK